MSWSDNMGVENEDNDPGELGFNDLNNVYNAYERPSELGRNTGISTVVLGEGGDTFESDQASAGVKEGGFRQVSELPGKISNWVAQMPLEIKIYADDLGEAMVEFARTNYTQRDTKQRGFQSDFGDLARSIFSEVFVNPDGVVLTIGARMKYAEYVEHVRAGTFAYLLPTLNAMRPKAEIVLRQRLFIFMEKRKREKALAKGSPGIKKRGTIE